MFPGRSEATKSMLCVGFAGAILGIRLWIDRGTDLLGKFRTKLGHSTLQFSQQTGQFVFLLRLSVIVRVLLLPACVLGVLRFGLGRVTLL